MIEMRSATTGRVQCDWRQSCEQAAVDEAEVLLEGAAWKSNEERCRTAPSLSGGLGLVPLSDVKLTSIGETNSYWVVWCWREERMKKDEDL